MNGNVNANSFIAGTNSTTYAENSIVQADDDQAFVINVAGGDAAGENFVVLADNFSIIPNGDVSAGSFSVDGGDVGINRTPTTNTFEVGGTASKVTAGDWLANSDARIKTDIKDLTDAVDVIQRLRPVEFRYTEEYEDQNSSIEDRPYYNFIAQEFQEVFPNQVQRTMGRGFYRSMRTPPAPREFSRAGRAGELTARPLFTAPGCEVLAIPANDGAIQFSMARVVGLWIASQNLSSTRPGRSARNDILFFLFLRPLFLHHVP